MKKQHFAAMVSPKQIFVKNAIIQKNLSMLFEIELPKEKPVCSQHSPVFPPQDTSPALPRGPAGTF